MTQAQCAMLHEIAKCLALLMVDVATLRIMQSDEIAAHRLHELINLIDVAAKYAAEQSIRLGRPHDRDHQAG